MKRYLEGISTRVDVNLDRYVVTYEKNGKVGKCIYKRFSTPGNNNGLRKVLPQSDYILVEVDFSPIIGEISKETKIPVEDYEVLRREIMDDSLRVLKNSQ